MISVRSRLVTLLVASSLVASLAITGSSQANSDWSIRISVANSSNYTDSTGKVWLSDRYYQGGSAWRNVQHVGDTDDPKLYQGHRWGMSGYNIPIPEAGKYQVKLHFAEMVFTQSGKRVFDVSAEGQTKVSRLDVLDQGGYASAYIETFELLVTDGTLNIGFGRVIEDPMISAIEVAQVSDASPPPAPVTFERRVNAGSNGSYKDKAGKTWSPDSSYVGGGGGTWSASATATVAGTEDAPLYRKHRWGMRAYRVAVPAKGTYQVKLHFAEMVFNRPGKRVFNVLAEGRKVISDLDVVAEVGHARALVKTFDVKVNDGVLNLRFPAIVEDPMVSGIEVVLAQSVDGGVTTTTAAPTTTAAAPTTTAAAPTTTTAAPTTTAAAPTTTTTTAPPPAPSAGFPDATNTGVRPGVALTPTGSVATSRDGQIIENLDVTGSIRVRHNDVVIRNVRVKRPGGEAIYMEGASRNLLVEDCELDGSGNSSGAAAIAFARYTIRRCNIHHFGEGMAANGDVTIEDNFIHSFTNHLSQGAHQDGIQAEWGNNITIRHNTIMMNVHGANASIWLGGNPHSNVLIENNLVAGGGFAIGMGGVGGNLSNVRAIDNKISTRFYPLGGYWGPFTYTAGSTLTGNRWYETNQPI